MVGAYSAILHGVSTLSSASTIAQITDAYLDNGSWFEDASAAKAKAFAHTIKVGDIFYSSWGYDQTNIDFYKVTKLVGTKSVMLIEMMTCIDHHDGCQSNMVIPGATEREGAKAILKRVQDGYKGIPSIKVSSHSYASPWGGQPVRETDGYSGH